MGVCASSGGMFNNYAIVQGVDHIVPVDIYLPGCPPRPEMLLDAILKLHDKIQNVKIGAHREAEIEELEQAGLRRLPLVSGTDQQGRQLAEGGQAAADVVTKTGAPAETGRP
jgi:NADH-quinone oxidoreductase subunit B